MDVNIIIALITAGFLVASVCYLFYTSRKFNPREKKAKKLERIRKMKAVENKKS